ncbi:L-seryl-tRNA(Sec) selenium transferase [bacterium]|nr:L-seryl-tRNA(Sec) selenium transferase [bacterium]
MDMESNGRESGEAGQSNESTAAKLAGIGSVEFWINHPGVIGYMSPGEGRIALTSGQVKKCVREGLADARTLLPDRSADSREVARECIGERLEFESSHQLHRVINATGIILHTNLGRSPIHPDVVQMATEIVSGYTNLEFDLLKGERSKRLAGLEAMLTDLSGAESALAVNNCAGALFLIITAIAGNPYANGQFVGRIESDWRGHASEVVISRGELIQIGGGFRIPRILEASGATLREVGSTNVTLPEDYIRALGDNTAMILKAHSSNFTMRGFVSSVTPPALAEIAHDAGIPLICDLGSATMVDERFLPFESKMTATPYINAGADLVCFSGDKLLGGPQAGIILGKASIVARLRRHPVMRTLRLDKWTGALLSSLLWTLGNEKMEMLPVLEMIRRDPAKDKRRALRMRKRISNSGLSVDIQAHSVTLGGGTLPGRGLSGWALALSHVSLAPDEIAAKLRRAKRPIIGIVQDDKLLLNMRTVFKDDERLLVNTLSSI